MLTQLYLYLHKYVYLPTELKRMSLKVSWAFKKTYTTLFYLIGYKLD